MKITTNNKHLKDAVLHILQMDHAECLLGCIETPYTYTNLLELPMILPGGIANEN